MPIKRGSTDITLRVGANSVSKVNRGSSNIWTSFTNPLSLSGLAAWYDASDATTMFDAVSGGSQVAANGTVARWQDKSGNANHLTQSVLNNRPLRKTNSIGTKDTVELDGTDDYLSLTTPLSSAAYTAFVVAKKVPDFSFPNSYGLFLLFANSAATFPVLMGDSFDVGGMYSARWSTSGNRFRVGYTTSRVVTTYSAVQVTARSATPNTQHWKDGAARTVVGYDDFSANADFNVCGGPWNGGFGYMSFGEIVFYNRELSDGDRALVESYLKTKWGTP